MSWTTYCQECPKSSACQNISPTTADIVQQWQCAVKNLHFSYQRTCYFAISLSTYSREAFYCGTPCSFARPHHQLLWSSYACIQCASHPSTYSYSIGSSVKEATQITFVPCNTITCSKYVEWLCTLASLSRPQVSWFLHRLPCAETKLLIILLYYRNHAEFVFRL